MRKLRWVGILSIALAAMAVVPAATATVPDETTTPPVDTTPPPVDTTPPPAPPVTPPVTPPPATTVSEALPLGESQQGVEGVTAEKKSPKQASATSQAATIETLPFTGADALLLFGIAACLIGAGFSLRRLSLEG